MLCEMNDNAIVIAWKNYKRGDRGRKEEEWEEGTPMFLSQYCEIY